MIERAHATALLDRVVPPLLGATVFAFAAGSSVEVWVADIGRPLRWVALALFAVTAIAYAAAAERRARLPLTFFAGAAMLAALALESSLWSLDARATAERAASFAVLVAAVTALAYAVAARPDAVRRLLLALLAAAAVVAVLSVVVLLVDPYNAWQAATQQYPRRFQGFEQNPNTGPMLLALGVPLACWRLLDAGSSRTRAAAVLVLGLFAGIIIASGSRGALAAAAVSLVVLVPVAGRTRGRRAAFAATAAAGIAAAVLLSQIPKALPASQGAPAQPAAAVQAPRNAERVLPLEDEQGRPGVGRRARPFRRRFLDVNGRLRPVLGAFGEGARRPVAGYGFGMESRVFVDRYYGFYSSVPENSYAGLFLQLGVAGLGLFALTFGAVLVAAIRALRRLDEHDRRITAVAGAAVVGGLVLGLSQSYVYAVGNIATLAVWSGAALLAAAAARPAAHD
jgi:hypothetical protein